MTVNPTLDSDGPAYGLDDAHLMGKPWERGAGPASEPHGDRSMRPWPQTTAFRERSEPSAWIGGVTNATLVTPLMRGLSG